MPLKTAPECHTRKECQEQLERINRTFEIHQQRHPSDKDGLRLLAQARQAYLRRASELPR